jgi:hypothetical protein
MLTRQYVILRSSGEVIWRRPGEAGNILEEDDADLDL